MRRYFLAKVVIRRWAYQDSHKQIAVEQNRVDRTVDKRNPAPVEVNIPLFTGFFTSQVVVWDFFHQRNRKITSTYKGIVFET